MKVKSFIRNIITICLIIVICICGYKIYSKLYEYKKADNIYNDLRKEKNYTNKNSSNKTNKNKENSIDFSHINKDFVCWINIKNTNIDYPVVQGDDNSYYLHRDIYGNYLYAGTTFLDYRNNYNDSKNLIVYGHNMKNGSMFGTLKQYKLQETIDKSPYFWIITPDEAYKYKIFAVYTANVDGDTYTLIKGPGTETVEYGESMKSKSDIDMGEYEFKQTDKMVTLSTCTGDSATRFVVQGVRVDPE